MKLYEFLIFLALQVAVAFGGYCLGGYIALEMMKPDVIKQEEQRSTELETKQIDE